MEFLKKNGFWISSFLLVAAMVGTWFYATGALKAATDTRVSSIKQAVSTADSIPRVEAEEGSRAHPNKSTEDGMNEKLDLLSQSVLQAWQKRYDAQKMILKWPERVLGQRFVREFSKYSPAESWPEDNKGDTILLDIYMQQIPSQMKEICSVIQTDWEFQDQLDSVADTEDKNSDDESGEDSTDDSNGASLVKSREIVEWNSNNQELWLEKLTSFRGRDDNEFQINRPTPSQVYMLQQDLWLLEAMFNIIRNVNARMVDGEMVMGPDNKPMMVQANDLAAVKSIDHVVFGREALARLGDITDTITTQADSQPGGRSSGRGGGAKTNSKASDTGLEYIGQPAFHGRYVDSNFEPIEAQTIRKILTENTLPSDNLELVAAKRVPVRLAVQMDERRIPRFLAACANSPFAFEVWQVRINKHDSDEVIKLRGGGGSGSAGGGGRGGRGGRPPAGLGGPAVGGAGGGGTVNKKKKSGTSVAVRQDYIVGVEFYGIVRIYNPVNEELLTGKKPDETATP